MAKGMRNGLIIGGGVFVFVLISLMYFYVLPPLAEKSVMLLPESFDNQIGNMFMETYIHENKIDFEKTKYLKQFASELNLGNTKPLIFTVVNSDEVNAFSLPNGQIVVYTGILNGMKSSDALVSLLGHEASHINKRHSIKSLCKDITDYIVVSLIFSDVDGIMSQLIENAHQLNSLSYSRKFEREADEFGLKILINNNVNPHGIIQLFEQLEKEDKFSDLEILSTHPLTNDRKENMKKFISESVYEVKTNNNLTSIFKHLQN